MAASVETQQPTPIDNQNDELAELGIIQPPPELKSIIDRTAEFVAKNGPNFEAKILANERDNPRFAFLRPGNPFYAYYQFKVRAVRKKEGILDPNDKAAVIKAAEEKLRLKKTLLGEIDEEEEEKKRKAEQKALKEKLAQAQKDQGPVEPPPPEEWVIEPPYISPLDIDIIKLSAQFIARNGKPFQFGLFNREAKNPQFGFLQENHPLHSYFRQLVESYSRVILPPKDIIENLEKMIHSKTMILDRIMKKVRWEKAQIKTEEQKKAEEEKERVLMASIDWHDFVVVETIDFDDDEKLPAPLADPTKLTKTSTDQIAEVDMETDMEIEKPTPSTKGPEPTPEQQPPEPTKVIGPEYKRRPPKPGDDLRSVRYQICPKCGQEIPVDEMAEHMKIELSGFRLTDRKTKEERQAAIAEGSEIEENLRRLAEKRTDIFGTHEEEDLEIGKGPTDDKSRFKVTWDGHTASIARITQEARQGLSLQDQIAAIHAAKGLIKSTTEKQIGPHVEPPPTSTSTSTSTTPSTTSTTPTTVSTSTSTTSTSTTAPSSTSTTTSTPSTVPPPPPPSRPPSLPTVPPRVVPPFAPYPPMMPYPPIPGMPPMPPYVPPGYPPMTTPASTATHERPSNPEEEPPAKRQKTEEGVEKEETEKVTTQLLPEAEWRTRITGPVTVKVSVPSVPEKSEWKLNGQVIEVQVNISDTIRNLKEKIQEILSMPVNRQKLKARELGVLNDQKTLAFYNFAQTMELELTIKERGGRKK